MTLIAIFPFYKRRAVFLETLYQLGIEATKVGCHFVNYHQILKSACLSSTVMLWIIHDWMVVHPGINNRDEPKKNQCKTMLPTRLSNAPSLFCRPSAPEFEILIRS